MSEKVYILHDNEAWLPPFRESLEKAGIEWEEWVSIDLILNIKYGEIKESPSSLLYFVLIKIPPFFHAGHWASSH